MDSNYSLSDIAAASGGEGFGGGNNAWVLILLFAMIFGFGGGGLFGNGLAGQTAATTADIQRAVDLNSVQEGQANIAADIQRGIYEINGATKDAAYNNLGEIRDVGAAIATGNSNIINNLTALQATLQNCCCETKSAIMENRYLDAQNTAAINANTTAAMQKVLDTIQSDKIASLTAEVSDLKTQQMFCGLPRINPYGYGVYPYANNMGCCNDNANI